MDRMLYLAMTGAKHTLQAQQHNNHNLANANTPGFRADFDSFLSRPVQGPGLPTRVFAEESTVGSDFRQGALMTTGRDLDVAINGEGWIAVQGADGTEAYTRRGDLRVSPTGLLETSAGELVLGNDGPIAVPPYDKLEIGTDGTVSIIPQGLGANTLAVLNRVRLVKAPDEGMVKADDGLFRTRPGFTAEPDAGVVLQNGALEGSNVNTVDALVKMIDHARAFETYVKLIGTVKQNDETSARLLRQS